MHWVHQDQGSTLRGWPRVGSQCPKIPQNRYLITIHVMLTGFSPGNFSRVWFLKKLVRILKKLVKITLKFEKNGLTIESNLRPFFSDVWMLSTFEMRDSTEYSFWSLIRKRNENLMTFCKFLKIDSEEQIEYHIDSLLRLLSPWRSSKALTCSVLYLEQMTCLSSVEYALECEGISRSFCKCWCRWSKFTSSVNEISIFALLSHSGLNSIEKIEFKPFQNEIFPHDLRLKCYFKPCTEQIFAFLNFTSSIT